MTYPRLQRILGGMPIERSDAVLDQAWIDAAIELDRKSHDLTIRRTTSTEIGCGDTARRVTRGELASWPLATMVLEEKSSSDHEESRQIEKTPGDVRKRPGRGKIEPLPMIGFPLPQHPVSERIAFRDAQRRYSEARSHCLAIIAAAAALIPSGGQP